MRTLLARTLLVACSVSLALPPGWCCLYATGARADKQQAASVERPCRGCCHKRPAPPSEPARPAPQRLPVCCCCPVNARTVPPASQKTTDTPVRLATHERPAVVAPALRDDDDRPVNPPYFTSTPLHVLRCVWLC
ncbi:MAG TPA: hypothetical protein VKE94_00565 [Gemmataceae bacterium]|nr:hypothetical protein [Gemmataceae bacterium]